MIQRIEIYGPGGYDPSKPNNNIIHVEEIEVEDPPAPSEIDLLRAKVEELEAEIKRLKGEE